MIRFTFSDFANAHDDKVVANMGRVKSSCDGVLSSGGGKLCNERGIETKHSYRPPTAQPPSSSPFNIIQSYHQPSNLECIFLRVAAC